MYTVYGSCRPSAVTDFQVHVSACVDDIAAWMLANRLQLNTGKTDLLWCATAHHCHQLPTTALRIKSDFLNPSKSIRDLGIYFDSDLSMRCHVQKIVASCFAVLHQLRSILRSVPTSVYQMLVVALVLSRLHYGNAVLVQPSPVGTQCRCMIHRRPAALGPHHRHTRQLPLAKSTRMCTVQASDDHLSITEWHGSIIPGCRPAIYVRHDVKMTSAVLTDTPAGCSQVAVRNCW